MPRIALIALLLSNASTLFADDHKMDIFEPIDVFQLEWANDPQISGDASQIVYVRNFMDIMKDRRRSNLWLIDVSSGEQRPLTSGTENHYAPRWSPDGERLAWISSADGSSQLWMRWMDTGQTARITHLTKGPGNISWSPDGEWIAFTMSVDGDSKPLGKMPSAPKGAEWAEPARVIDKMIYRFDGAGFLPTSYTHIFVVPANGGSPRQITSGDFNHGGTPSWSADGKSLYFSANRHPDFLHQPNNSEVYRVDIASGKITQLTDRFGPDNGAEVSPDGSKIAFAGFNDEFQGFTTTQLYVMDADGDDVRMLSGDLDRSVGQFEWSDDGRSLVIGYTDQGIGKVARIDLNGRMSELADNLGGTAMGRPYAGGNFSVSDNGTVAYTFSKPARPAEVAISSRRGRNFRQLTRLNDDLFGHKQLAEVEEIWYESSHDNWRVQGWIAKPPGFDPEKQYPLVLEIHGGPFAAYGPHFSAEVQLYAAAGNVVLYTNPRGSTSYGEEFANYIHHNYPSEDFDDLMSGVDAVIAQGYIDPDRLYITGGSGGGVLTAWSVGHTERFRAAAVQKPVINWYSFVLTADAYNFFHQYWFDSPPWEDPQPYLDRSPISYVGNVTTPTLVITGESDYRTPMSESEQYYQALQIRKIPSALVRIPGASHGIANRPSQLIAKVQNILGWFERYNGDAEEDDEG